MILRYRQEDGTIRDFTFKPGELLSPEVELIEEIGGSAWETFDMWGEKFMKGNRRAFRAGLFIMLKRENPKLRFNELAVRADAITYDFDEGEQEQIKAEIREVGKDLDPDQRSHLRMMIGELEEIAGKDSGTPSESSVESTDSESAKNSTPA